MNHHFEEDRAELEAHFRERLQAYIELGETPEQALLSAREKFGEMEVALKALRWQRRRNALLGRPLGVLGIGLIWGFLWAVLFAALLSGLSISYPDQFDQGEEPLVLAAIIGCVGWFSGSLFGVLLSLAENGKAIRHLSLGRVALWGGLGSAAFPLIQHADQIIWTCPLGAMTAMAVLAFARKAERRGSQRSRRLRDFFSACVHTTVRYAIRPLKKPVKD